MRFTTTFTSIATCSLLIVATLTSADPQPVINSNSLAFATPEQQQNVVSIRPMLNNRIEKRRVRLMTRGDRYQEEAEEEDEDEEEEDEEEEEEGGRSSRHRTSSRRHRGSSRGHTSTTTSSGPVGSTADPAVHKVSRTGDKLLSKVPLSSTLTKTLHKSGRKSRSSRSKSRGRLEEDEA